MAVRTVSRKHGWGDPGRKRRAPGNLHPLRLRFAPTEVKLAARRCRCGEREVPKGAGRDGLWHRRRKGRPTKPGGVSWEALMVSTLAAGRQQPERHGGKAGNVKLFPAAANVPVPNLKRQGRWRERPFKAGGERIRARGRADPYLIWTRDSEFPFKITGGPRREAANPPGFVGPAPDGSPIPSDQLGAVGETALITFCSGPSAFRRRSGTVSDTDHASSPDRSLARNPLCRQTESKDLPVESFLFRK